MTRPLLSRRAVGLLAASSLLPAAAVGAETVRSGAERLLRRFSTFVEQRDKAVLGDFVQDSSARMMGSEQGELCRGLDAIGAQFDRLYSHPFRIGWSWNTLDCDDAGEIGWLLADGYAILREGERETRLPYGLSGVLRRVRDTWRWQVFHGAELSTAR